MRNDRARRAGPRLARLDDERLAALVGRGDAAAFETLYDRHHAALLAFCRHMLGDRQDGEDALQQAFLRAHRALREGRAPERVRPWLFAIARNRCLTQLAARRDAAVPIEDLEPSFDGLSSEVERRADLRELVSDLARLPDDQRGALVLAELGDFNHAEIGRVIGCSTAKVKALVFQARTSLIADRDARSTPCAEIRTLLETARGGVLRRGALRRHLRQCDPCAAYRVAMEGRRSGLGLVLPVAPTAGLKAAVLGGAGGLGGGAQSVAAAAALLAPGSLGAASGGGIAGGAAAAGGIAAKALVAKAAVAVAIGAGAAGGAVAVHDRAPDDRIAKIERAAERPPADLPAAATPGEDEQQLPVSDSLLAASAVPATGTHMQPRTRRAVARRLRALTGGRPRAGHAAARRLRVLTGGRPRARRAAARRLRVLTGGRPRARRAIRRIAAGSPRVRHRIRRLVRQRRERAREHAKADAIGEETVPERRRRRREARAPVPEPTATPTPTATPELEARPRRRKRPDAPPTPTPTAEPTPTATATPSAEPTATPTVTPTPEP